jgi:hypothetical protein
MLFQTSLFVGVGLAASIRLPDAHARRALPISNVTLVSYSVPGDESLAVARAADIQTKRSTFTYGPTIEGGGPYSPNGTLGEALIAKDEAIFYAETIAEMVVTQNDTTASDAQVRPMFNMVFAKCSAELII